ncbi:MAG: cation:proton antiporter [Bacteroidota bacterium]|nr:cation:proton antiporter [Bacteroidota bacterium]
MDQLSPQEVFRFLLALAVLLATARLFGEGVKRFNQPAVLGEILAGIVLGPTVLGEVAPKLQYGLFPLEGNLAVARDGLTTLAIVLFLLVAGMEVDLSTLWRQGRVALFVSLFGLLVPFSLAFSTAITFPSSIGWEPGVDITIFGLFFASALSISALPVIAKTLLDMNLYRSDLGMTIIAAAIFNDLIGWVVIAVILGMMGTGVHGQGIGNVIFLTLAFVAGVLTLGRWVIHRLLPILQAHTSWPGGVLAFALSLALAGGAFTQWVGIHAIFGSFIIGVALGDSSHLRQQTRAIIDRFVSFIFAPLFFASIGLKVNFATNFDPFLTLVILAIAVVGKTGGSSLGARIAGLTWKEGLTIGSGMVSVGTMGIIVGLLALQYGIIHERMFVAIVIMAVVTSLLSGPAMTRILKPKKPKRFTDFLASRSFIPSLKANERKSCIGELVSALPLPQGFDPGTVSEIVWEREQLMPTGLGMGLAVPHARLESLPAPLVAVGISRQGVDFDAPDGEPAFVVVLLLTPSDEDSTQLELLADIAHEFHDEDIRNSARFTKTYTEFLALMKSHRL